MCTGCQSDGRGRRELEAAGLAATFQEALSDGGAQLPVMRALDHLQHVVKGGAAELRPTSGSIWRALIATHWRASIEVNSATTTSCCLSSCPDYEVVPITRLCSACWRRVDV